MRAIHKAISQIAVALPLFCAPGALMAQEIGSANAITVDPQLDRSDVAGARVEPDFEPQPLPAGAFLIEPSLSVVAGYNSNVLNQNNGTDDVVLTLTPRLRVRTSAPVHLLQLTATGFIRRFASVETENSEEYDLSLRSRYDVDEVNNVFATASHAREIEPRSSLTANPLGGEPVSYTNTRGEVGGNIGLGKLEIRPSVHIAERDYSLLDLTGGGTADQSFRDTRSLGGELQVAYKFSPLVAAFASGNFTEQDNLTPNPGFDRSSEDIALLAGVRGELSPVLSGELAVGYRKRDYDLAIFPDFDGLTYRADLQYFPTELVTLRLQASQNFRNAGNQQVAGVLTNRITASAYYDPLRNLRLMAQVGYETNDFREANTDAKRPSLRFQGEYRLNRNLSVGAYAGVLRQDVSGALALQEFTSFSAGVGVTLTP